MTAAAAVVPAGALICRVCVRRVVYLWHMSWWECACRVWATDEHLAGRSN